MKEYDPSTAFDEVAGVSAEVQHALKRAEEKVREATKAFNKLGEVLPNAEGVQLHHKRGTGKRWGGKRRKRKVQ